MDRQSIDVRAQHHRLAGLAGIEQRDHPGLGGTVLQLESEHAQPLAEVRARVVLAEADLGPAMEIATQLDDLVDHRFARQRCGLLLVAH